MHVTSKKIESKIRIYAIISVIAISIIITAITLIPLYIKLRDAEQRGILFARDASVLIVNEYIANIKHIAQRLSKNKAVLHSLASPDTKSNVYGKLQSTLKTILISTLNSNAQIVGIIRINKKGDILTRVGKDSPRDTWINHINGTSLHLYNPFLHNNHYYISIYSPIVNIAGNKVGADIILFDITSLQAIINQKIQHHMGDILIAFSKNKQIQLFSPIKTPWRDVLTTDNILTDAINNASNNDAEDFVSGKLFGKKIYIAYSPLIQPHWSLAVVVKKDKLLASIQSEMIAILIIVLIIILLFVLGLNLCLKPLSGRIIMRSKELERQIKLSQKKLTKANLQLTALVNNDSLTNIHNRRGFNQEFSKILSYSVRHSTVFTLLFIDINKFKSINDEIGHDAGDIVLKTLGERMVLSMRKEDVISRIGGDEFSVIAPGLDEQQAQQFISKLYEVAQIPVTFEQQSIHLSISIGSATFPINGETLEALMSYADDKMYHDKKSR